MAGFKDEHALHTNFLHQKADFVDKHRLQRWRDSHRNPEPDCLPSENGDIKGRFAKIVEKK